MQMKEIRTVAQQLGLSAGKLRKAELIRAIQRQEGNSQCFGSQPASCGQAGCLWRKDCQSEAAA